jgi:hypothetical protein
MKKLASILLTFFALALTASAQSRFSNAGFEGGWEYISGNQGTNGFTVGTELIVVRPVSIAFNYDGVWNNSTIGVFQLTSVGLTTTHTHLQDAIIGPRVYLPGLFKDKNNSTLRKLSPFAEAQFGESWISSRVSSVSIGTVSASTNAFTWELGGGADIRLNPHWAFRTKVGYLRTHFVSGGQNHVRFSLGVAYAIRPRKQG